MEKVLRLVKSNKKPENLLLESGENPVSELLSKHNSDSLNLSFENLGINMDNLESSQHYANILDVQHSTLNPEGNQFLLLTKFSHSTRNY